MSRVFGIRVGVSFQGLVLVYLEKEQETATIEDSQRYFSVPGGSRRPLVLPFWVPLWELEAYLIARS